MKITEIIKEDQELHPEHKSVMSNLSTFPDQNMYHGKGADYHARFLIALAGAGAGDTPDAHMGEKSWDGTDPTYSPFHPMELEMLDRAAKHIGDTSERHWGEKESKEPDNINKTSPHRNPGPVGLRSKSKTK